MGCDIHIFVEIKYKGEWIYAGRGNEHRNYDWFGILNNVRREHKIERDWLDLDLPENCSDYVQTYFNNSEYFHSITYLNLKQIGEAWKLYAEQIIENNVYNLLEEASGEIKHPIQKLLKHRLDLGYNEFEIPEYEVLTRLIPMEFYFDDNANFVIDDQDSPITDARIVIGFDN